MEPGRASRTAEIVAARRAAHQTMDRPIVFEDPLAIRLAAPGVVERLRHDRGFLAKRWSQYLRAALAVRSRSPRTSCARRSAAAPGSTSCSAPDSTPLPIAIHSRTCASSRSITRPRRR